MRLRPFASQVWPAHLQAPAQLLWNLHDALQDGVAPASVPHDIEALCNDYGLPVQVAENQINAARRYAGPIRFATSRDLLDFSRQFAGSHGQLLGHLVDCSRSWHRKPIEEFSTAMFLASRLFRVEADIRKDHVFFPMSDMESGGSIVEDFRKLLMIPTTHPLVWRHIVRIKGALAQALSMGDEQTGWVRREFFRSCLGTAYLLDSFRRSDLRLGAVRPELSRLRRLQFWIHRRFGRIR